MLWCDSFIDVVFRGVAQDLPVIVASDDPVFFSWVCEGYLCFPF